MQRINFLVNTQREDALRAACETAQWLRSLGIKVTFDQESAQLLNEDSVPLQKIGDADLVVTFGGDGTLIHASAYCSETLTPILGVYYGRFGFVTQCEPHEVRTAIRQFLDGEAEYDDRMMLKGELIRGDTTVATLHALNEIAVQRSIVTRMMIFSVRLDWEDITSYPADGILVATPTGSTAYNLSAGGPIVDPHVEAMILTPITPHSLAVRPLVLSPESVVELSIGARGDVVVSADGQFRLNMLSGDKVTVRRSERRTRLLLVDRRDFLIKLRTRLLWGARS
ncbi:MAG TPA: NAD(+)/NADH kinase [Fimbriimonadales bacterium]|nr:NAD(+)/NADH kinase [Fimbriimonadales bacterium]